MSVFISWAGSGAKVAEAFADLLRHTLQGSNSFLSTRDIGSGRIWFQKVQAGLSAAKFGVVIATSDALASPWVMFEAGAVWKANDDAAVAALLVGISPADLAKSPFEHFQARNSLEREVFALLLDIRNALGLAVEDDVVRQALSTNWARFEEAVRSHRPLSQESPRQEPTLTEMMERLRDIEGFLVQQSDLQRSDYFATQNMIAAMLPMQVAPGIVGPSPLATMSYADVERLIEQHRESSGVFGALARTRSARTAQEAYGTSPRKTVFAADGSLSRVEKKEA